MVPHTRDDTAKGQEGAAVVARAVGQKVREVGQTVEKFGKDVYQSGSETSGNFCPMFPCPWILCGVLNVMGDAAMPG